MEEIKDYLKILQSDLNEHRQEYQDLAAVVIELKTRVESLTPNKVEEKIEKRIQQAFEANKALQWVETIKARLDKIGVYATGILLILFISFILIMIVEHWKNLQKGCG